MSSTRNNEISRIIIEMPKTQHTKLKMRAAMLGKSMKEIILDALELTDACLQSNHYPNKETLKALKDIEEGKNLTKYESLEDFAKKLGL